VSVYGNMIDLVFGDYVELVIELSKDIGRSFDGYCYFATHAHRDLNN